jgi:hypothetical protein
MILLRDRLKFSMYLFCEVVTVWKSEVAQKKTRREGGFFIWQLSTSNYLLSLKMHCIWY